MNLRDNRRQKRLWTLADYVWNIAAFCCLATVVAALSYIALCALSATEPSVTRIALQLIALSK
jgi:hypothetical protein